MTNKFVNNNNKSEGFGIQKSEDDLSWVSTESIEIFTRSLSTFAQSSNLLAWSIEKSIQSMDVLSYLANELK